MFLRWCCLAIFIAFTMQIEYSYASCKNSFRNNVIYVNNKRNRDNLGHDIKNLVQACYNIIILGFFVPTMENKVRNAVEEWIGMPKEVRMNTLDYAHKMGAKILVSSGGPNVQADDILKKVNSTEYGQKVANFALEWDFDGVDINMDFHPASILIQLSNEGPNFLSGMTREIRKIIGNDKLLTHAAQISYFAKSWTRFGYRVVHKNVGNLIDFYNIKFYNQGQERWNDYKNLFVSKSDGWLTKTSVNDLIKDGIPQEKIVIGTILMQPNEPSRDGDTPTAEHKELWEFGCKGKEEFHWDAGFMVWQYNQQQIKVVDRGFQLGNTLCPRESLYEEIEKNITDCFNTCVSKIGLKPKINTNSTN